MLLFLTHRCVSSVLIITIILCVTITVVLPVLLIKLKQSKPKLNSIIICPCLICLPLILFALVVNPVLRWDPVGVTVAGIAGINGTNNSLLNNPWGLALTYDSTLYIADRYNDRIQKYWRNSLIGETLPGLSSATLFKPAKILLDSNENLYIADGSNHRVVFWTASTNSSVTIAGTGIHNKNPFILDSYSSFNRRGARECN